MLSRDHYQRAFEGYLRGRGLSFVSVDEARRSIAPGRGGRGGDGGGCVAGREGTLKSFDLVVSSGGANLLVEVKGRKVVAPASRQGVAGPGVRGRSRARGARPARARLESWVTRDDVESLGVWEGLFGAGFVGVFAFVYWCERAPPGVLFEDSTEHDGRWYAIRCVRRDQYAAAMRTRSQKWGTVHLASDAFDRLSRPLACAAVEAGPSGREAAPGAAPRRGWGWDRGGESEWATGMGVGVGVGNRAWDGLESGGRVH